MPIQGVIFDVDGVLVDTVPLHFAAWQRVFSERGYPFDERVYREQVDGKSRLDGVRGVMRDASEDEVAEAGALKQIYFLEQLETAPLDPFPDILSLVAHLENRGIRRAAASSSVNAPRVLSKIGMLDEMDAVVTGADISRGKPDPEIFLTAAHRLRLTPPECVVFEDSEAGVEAASRGGFLSVGVARQDNARYLSQADLIVSSLEGITVDELEHLAAPRSTE